MKLIGSTSTVSFIPDGILNSFRIILIFFCIFDVFLALIKSLLRNLRLILKIGALTGPRIFSLIEFVIIFFNNLLNNKNSRFAGIDGGFYFNNSIIERDLDILEIDNGYAYKIN